MSDPVTGTDENDREDESLWEQIKDTPDLDARVERVTAQIDSGETVPLRTLYRGPRADPDVVDLGCCDDKGDEHELGGEG